MILPLSRRIVEDDYTLIYGNSAHGFVRNAVLAAKLARRRVIWHIREMVDKHPMANKIIYRFADALIAVSRACASELPSSVRQDRVFVVHNGVDIADVPEDREAARHLIRREFDLPDACPLIVCVANVCARKGQRYAVEAMETILRDVPEAQLVLAGKLDEGAHSYTQELRNLIASKGLDGCVHIVGFRTDTFTLLRSADLLMHTALRDPHPRAVVEAMACGLPVVAFAVDGVTETIVNGVTGCLVPKAESRALAEGAVRILSDPRLGAAMGSAGRERVQAHFLAHSTADAVANIIEQVIARG